MHFGSPEFALTIIGMAMIAGVLKSWGKPHRRGSKQDRREAAEIADANAALRSENSRLRERIEHHEDRIIALERIVTDSGYDVARQIERLRDPGTPLPRMQTSRDRVAR